MATKTITTKVDDIDGSPADASFTFSWQGSKYHIDLSAAHAAELKADFDKWVSAGRRDRGGARTGRGRAAAKPAPVAEPVVAEPAPKAPAKRGPKAGAKPAARRGRAAKKPTGPSTAEIRAWATAHGIAVADRGRLAPTIIAQFLADKA